MIHSVDQIILLTVFHDDFSLFHISTPSISSQDTKLTSSFLPFRKSLVAGLQPTHYCCLGVTSHPGDHIAPSRPFHPFFAIMFDRKEASISPPLSVPYLPSSRMIARMTYARKDFQSSPAPCVMQLTARVGQVQSWSLASFYFWKSVRTPERNSSNDYLHIE